MPLTPLSPTLFYSCGLVRSVYFIPRLRTTPVVASPAIRTSAGLFHQPRQTNDRPDPRSRTRQRFRDQDSRQLFEEFIRMLRDDALEHQRLVSYRLPQPADRCVIDR